MIGEWIVFSTVSVSVVGVLGVWVFEVIVFFSRSCVFELLVIFGLIGLVFRVGVLVLVFRFLGDFSV